MFQPGKLLNHITQIIILKHFLIVEICNSDVSMCPSPRGRGLVVRRIVKVLEWKTHTNSCLWNMCGTRDKTKLTHCARATYYHIYPHLVLTSQCLSVSVMKPLQHLGISCIEHDLFDVLEPRRLGAALDFQPWRDFAENRPRFRSCWLSLIHLQLLVVELETSEASWSNGSKARNRQDTAWDVKTYKPCTSGYHRSRREGRSVFVFRTVVFN